MNNRYHIWRKHMILVNGENVTDFRTEKYNPGFRMLEIVENCPFVGCDFETRNILTALAAGQNVVLYGQSGLGKTAFAEWAKKAFGAGECIETYSYKKFKHADEIDETKTNIVIFEDHNYYWNNHNSREEIHPEIMDKCLLRIKFEKLSDEDFREMLLSGSDTNDDIAISADEINFWKEEISKIEIPDEIFTTILKMRTNERISIGDGEWYKALQLLKASAYFNRNEEVFWEDFKILFDSIFQDGSISSIHDDQVDIFLDVLAQSVYRNKDELGNQYDEGWYGRNYIIWDGGDERRYSREEAKEYFKELIFEV